MDALKPALALALLVSGRPAAAQGAPDAMAQWAPIVAEASARFGIPITWITRVIRAESGGNTMQHGRPIRSRVGAIGLMQLMPATWQAMRADLQLGADPDDPHDNIVAGTAYLRLMADRFGYPGLFAAYNAGPARTAAWLAGRSRLPAETIAYLRAITGGSPPAAIIAASPPPQLLFALRHDMDALDPAAPARPAQDGLFAIRRGQR
jgi:soluble lytic murein transglycosylase-like protein